MRLVTLENLMTEYLGLDFGSIVEVESWDKVFFVKFKVGRPAFVSKAEFKKYWNDSRKFGIYNIAIRDKKSFNVKKAVAQILLRRGYNVTVDNLVTLIKQRTQILGDYIRYTDHKITISELFLETYKQLELNSLVGVPLEKLYTMVFIV